MTFDLRIQQTLWNSALGDLSVMDKDPEPEVLAFLQLGPSIIGSRGLDIGCGLGRHTLAALEMGYTMSAIDLSTTATVKTIELIQAHGYRGDVRCASMDSLPYDSGTFDFVFAWCVLNHGTRELFNQSLYEALRVLRPDGTFFGFVMNRNDSRFGYGIPVAQNCFAFTEGPESGVIHYFPSRDEIVSILEVGASIVHLEELEYDDEENTFYHPEMRHSSYFSFLARKK